MKTILQYLHIIMFLIILVNSNGNADLATLTPDDDAFIAIDEFIAVFSYSQSSKVVKSVKVFFDKDDISLLTRQTGATITFTPDQNFLTRSDIEGPHLITVFLYGSYREILEKKTLRFYLVKNLNMTDEQRKSYIEKGKTLQGITPREFVNTGKIYAGTFYEKINNEEKLISELDAYGSGSISKFNYNYMVYLNSNEEDTRQTLQRFRIRASYSNIISLSIGDNRPMYHPMLLNDCRVRGMELSLKTTKNNVGLEVVYGTSQRAIKPFVADSKGLNDSIARFLPQLNDSTFNHNDSLTYIEDGTYKRKLLASRLHFGNGKLATLGLSFIKAKDDTNSIVQKEQKLPDGRFIPVGQTPKDNLAAGADFVSYFWNRRISLYGNYGFSFLTKNILGGPISSEKVMELTNSESDPLKAKNWENIIILNQTTVPIPLSADTSKLNISGSLKSSMAWNAGTRISLPFNPIKNDLSFEYFSHGANFSSLGNEKMQVDREGFQIAEMISWKHLASLRATLDYYHDNLNKIKSGTTKTLRYSLVNSISINNKLPRLTLRFNNNIDKTTDDIIHDYILRKNKIRNAGLSLFQLIPVKSTNHSVSFNYDQYQSKISMLSIISDVANVINMTINNQWMVVPLQSRFQVTTNIAKSFSYTGTSAGITWIIQPDKMYGDFDLGRDYSKIEVSESKPVTIWKLRSSYNYDINKRHSLYAEIGSYFSSENKNKPEPRGRFSYEFRY
jgi:hypothetical protein